MKETYLLPIIQREIEREYPSIQILKNPRITEINNIIIEQAKNTGNVFMYDPLSDIYETKLSEMIRFLLRSSNYIEIDQYGSIQINFPEYIDTENGENRKEYIKFSAKENRKMLKVREKIELEPKTGPKRIEESFNFDEFGIELKREVTEKNTHGEKRIKYERLDDKPHIIKLTNSVTGEIKYLDIRDSEHFENLDILNSKQLKKEEIEDLTQIEKIRMIEKTSKSVYAEGIRTILGMQINLDQVSPDTER